MKLSKGTKAAIGYCVGMSIVYLMGAFVAWDLNAGNWAKDGRFMVAIMGVFGGMVVAGISSEAL